ncbi:trigger factor [Rickettsiella endosymbiont of Dermanyssus gallinae]|uniref:trigger factor n=1 Tax=Rickettsiella endosymbiont of Dermanyssus gallinae TaxID=2856608 RepID=UPI001C529A58|nr:trigger factor [Rickettsiella endosymbiont of Dermanyssus gallinae]
MNDMQVSVENVGRLNRRLSVIVPSNQLEQHKKNRLAELAKKTRLDGFRPGKVPTHVVEKLYGDSVWGDVIQESLQTSLSAALQKNALNPAGQPHIDSIKAEPGNDLEYTASFEVYPQVSAPELKSVSLEKLKVDITDADIVEVLEKMRHQHADWIETQRKAQQGDKVTFDLTLSDGTEPRKDLEWVLEEGKMPEGFAGLFGSTAGETLNVSLAGGNKEQQAEKTNSATVQVQKVSEPKLAELDDAFAQRLGIHEGGMETLRTQIRQHMQNELDRVLREKLKTQVIDKLIELYAIEELPQVLLDQEFQRLEAELKGQQKQQGKSSDEPLSEEAKNDLQLAANRRVTLGLLFSAVIETHQLQADEARVLQEVERLASAFQFAQSIRERLYKDKNMMLNIRSSVLEEQVIDKLLEEAEYTEKTVQYNEMMNLSAKTQEEGAEK